MIRDHRHLALERSEAGRKSGVSRDDAAALREATAIRGKRSDFNRMIASAGAGLRAAGPAHPWLPHGAKPLMLERLLLESLSKERFWNTDGGLTTVGKRHSSKCRDRDIVSLIAAG